ncbi:MAG TPA: hypothetical protein VK210_12190 [Terriglobia bacterium]|nr:hypothetical protein [Terriglobia bacterium]
MTMQAIAQIEEQRFLQTIDVQVLNSESVVIGKILTLRRNVGSVDAVIAVDETLKGTPQKAQRLHVADQYSPVEIRSSEIEQLFKKNKAARLLVSGNMFTILDRESLAVPTANRKTIREPEEVIRYAREVIQSHPGVNQIQTVAVSGLIVPVDAQLEKWAIEAIISRGPDINHYYDGVRALQFFKSDTNISLLRTLLDDPTSSLEGRNGVLVRIYYVRGPAYNVLKKWNVPVAETVLTEEIPKSQVR